MVRCDAMRFLFLANSAMLDLQPSIDEWYCILTTSPWWLYYSSTTVTSCFCNCNCNAHPVAVIDITDPGPGSN